MKGVRYAPVRYKVCCIDGWRWRSGYAVHLPSHPAVRVCVTRRSGERWCVDQYDTGYAMNAFSAPSRAGAVRLLLKALPKLVAGGAYAKRLQACARMIRRARALGGQPARG